MKVSISICPAPFLYYKFLGRRVGIRDQVVYNCGGLKINIHLLFLKVAMPSCHANLCCLVLICAKISTIYSLTILLHSTAEGLKTFT